MNRPRVWPIFVAFIVAAVATAVFAAGVGMLEGGLAANAAVQASPRLMVEAVLATQAALLVAVLCFARPLSAQRLGLAPGRPSAGLTLAAGAGTGARGGAAPGRGGRHGGAGGGPRLRRPPARAAQQVAPGDPVHARRGPWAHRRS